MTGATASAGRPEQEPAWSDKVVRLNEALAAAQVPYAFGGAIALNYHREPRSTLVIDINLFVPPETEEPVLNTLADLYDVTNRQQLIDDIQRDGQARASWGHTYLDLLFPNTDFHASMAQRGSTSTPSRRPAAASWTGPTSRPGWKRSWSRTTRGSRGSPRRWLNPEPRQGRQALQAGSRSLDLRAV